MAYYLFLLLGILFSSVPKIENDYNSIFSNANNFVFMITIISMLGFSILCLVMHCKFIIYEYVGKKDFTIYISTKKK